MSTPEDAIRTLVHRYAELIDRGDLDGVAALFAHATWRARSAFTVFQARPGFPLQAIVCGRYEDAFEHVDGAWRFTDRLVVPELIGDLSHHLRGPWPA